MPACDQDWSAQVFTSWWAIASGGGRRRLGLPRSMAARISSRVNHLASDSSLPSSVISVVVARAKQPIISDEG